MRATPGNGAKPSCAAETPKPAAVGAVLSGYRPEIMDSLRLEGPDAKGMMYLAVAIGLTVIFGIVGFVMGKMAK